METVMETVVVPEVVTPEVVAPIVADPSNWWGVVVFVVIVGGFWLYKRRKM